MKKKIIRTSSRELYNKLNLLHFSNEVILKDSDGFKLSKILKNINSGEEVLEVYEMGLFKILRKKKPFDFEIYLSQL